MNRQFPCILKGSYIWLAFDKRNATTLDSDHSANKGNINFEHDGFDNITAEYLANTYGEVKSKEHAEFIVKLAEVNGFDIGIKSNTPSVFEFSGMLLNIYANDISSFAHNVESKQITIPLPPKCEEKTYRYEGIGQKPKHFDCICTKCGGRCCIGSCDEWPVVGSSVEWGHTGKGEVKSLSDGFAWIKLDNKDYTTVYVSSLRKPKTQEQKLNDELYELCLTHCDSKFQASEIARKLMKEYDIKKKPQ